MAEIPRRKHIPLKFATGNLRLPYAMPLERIEALLLKMMRDASVDPAVIYAYETTLHWVTEDTVFSLSKKQLAEWDKALLSFHNRKK